MRGLGMESPARTDAMIPLPDNETPMIRKNQSMRENQQRRSSLGLRGQRASTSLGRGDISEPTPNLCIPKSDGVEPHD
jgi:kinetochore protein Mis13/DSN1